MSSRSATVAGVAVFALGGVVVLAGAATAAASDPFVEETKGVVVDWRKGTLTAVAGAAADLRAPSAEVARAGSERRARAAARARLADALGGLPIGGGRRLDAAAIARAVGRGRTVSVDYQSNGGVVIRVEVAFGAWTETPAAGAAPSAVANATTTKAGATPAPAPVALWLAEGRLAAAPVLVVDGREIALGSARYAPAAALPSGTRPVTVRADKSGRLVVAAGASAVDLASGAGVIYVQKILR